MSATCLGWTICVHLCHSYIHIINNKDLPYLKQAFYVTLHHAGLMHVMVWIFKDIGMGWYRLDRWEGLCVITNRAQTTMCSPGSWWLKNDNVLRFAYCWHQGSASLCGRCFIWYGYKEIKPLNSQIYTGCSPIMCFILLYRKVEKNVLKDDKDCTTYILFSHVPMSKRQQETKCFEIGPVFTAGDRHSSLALFSLYGALLLLCK